MSGKKIAIMQPTYLPWLGYFDLIKKVDVFVIYNHVQFEKRSWQQRNRIRTVNSELMLTVPVSTKGKFDQAISEVEIDKTQHFVRKHLSAIKNNYIKSICFESIYKELEEIYMKDHLMIQDLNVDLIKLALRIFDISTQLIFSTDLNVQGSKVEALIDVCKKLKADEYISPPGSKQYIDENNLFLKNNIELSYHHFEHPIYKQITYKNFISHLAFIDYLFNTNLNNNNEI